MSSMAYRYKFDEKVDLAEAEDTLLLSILAAEGIYGQARVRMDCRYAVDSTIGVILLDASSDVGQDVAGIFTAFLTKEFGPRHFHVCRVELLAGGRREVRG